MAFDAEARAEIAQAVMEAQAPLLTALTALTAALTPTPTPAVAEANAAETEVVETPPAPVAEPVVAATAAEAVETAEAPATEEVVEAAAEVEPVVEAAAEETAEASTEEETPGEPTTDATAAISPSLAVAMAGGRVPSRTFNPASADFRERYLGDLQRENSARASRIGVGTVTIPGEDGKPKTVDSGAFIEIFRR